MSFINFYLVVDPALNDQEMTKRARGELYKHVGVDMQDRVWYEPSIIDALNDARRTLRNVKTQDELRKWAKHWFGDEF